MSKSARLNCRNWECGVIIPMPALPGGGLEIDENAPQSENGLAVFEGVVPLPMEYPADEYGTMKPWFYAEH